MMVYCGYGNFIIRVSLTYLICLELSTFFIEFNYIYFVFYYSIKKFYYNLVNKRLAGDESEDSNFPKIQFPNAETCSKCHRVSDGEFDEAEIAQFLIARNSPDQIVLSEGGFETTAYF